MSYGGVTEDAVRDLVHGAIFTRGPKDLHNTAIFIGGTDMAAGERLLAAVRKTFFGPMRVSVMLDSNGSNTTAVAAVAKLQQAAGRHVAGRRAVVTAGTGPVGVRAAGLLAQAGADVVITSRRPRRTRQLVDGIQQRFGGAVQRGRRWPTPRRRPPCSRAPNCSSTPVRPAFVSSRATRWAGRAGPARRRRLNAVPPLGIEGHRGDRQRRRARRRDGVRRARRRRPEDEDPQGVHRPPVRAATISCSTRRRSPRSRARWRRRNP